MSSHRPPGTLSPPTLGKGHRAAQLPGYLPARQAVARLPVASQLDGRVFCKELVDILHCNLAHIYINGALCGGSGEKQKSGSGTAVVLGQLGAVLSCIPPCCPQCCTQAVLSFPQTPTKLIKKRCWHDL